MALSGSFGKNVPALWRLQAEWTATQNISANTSSVTLRLYWLTDSSNGAIYASASDPVSITINGNTSDYATSTPALSGRQKKLIRSHTVTVPHNADGTKTFNMSAYFDVNASLSGSWVGRVSISGSATLNTIPRASTLSSSPSWTAGRQRTVSVNRHSSNFTHNIKMYVQNRAGSWIHVNEVDLGASQTSVSSDFSDSENAYIYQQLDGRSSASSRMVVHTYSGSTLIGTSSHDGTVTALQASYPVIPSSFNIGSSFTVQSAYYNRDFTHDIRLKNGSTVLKTITKGPVGAGEDSIATFTTSDIATALYNLTPNAKTKSLTIEITTRMGSSVVRSPRSETISAVVTNSTPTFTATPTYADTNSATIAITGNNQYVISGKSTVRATLTAAQRALPRNGATMVRYVATLGGKTVTQNYSTTATLTFDFGTLDAQTNQTLVISAVDSRGFSTPVTKVVTVIPYNDPGIAVSANRINGFEVDTIVTLAGTVQSLKVNDVEKNYVKTSRIRYKLTSGSAWEAWQTFPTTGFPSFTATDKVLSLNRLNSYDIQVEVSDVLGTTSAIRTVSSGKPLMFIDELLGSIGMGEFPTLPNQLLLTHQLDFAAGRFGSGNYAMDLNKGNVHGANGIFFYDETTSTEGINFLKTGRPHNSRTFGDYDTLNMNDGALKINGTSIAHELQGEEVLWEGSLHMTSSHTIVPSKPLSHCPTGWILVWSEYVNGNPTNGGWGYTHIPKFDRLNPGANWIAVGGASGGRVTKYIYVGNNDMTGHNQNNNTTNSQVVLRYVLSY